MYTILLFTGSNVYIYNNYRRGAPSLLTYGGSSGIELLPIRRINQQRCCHYENCVKNNKLQL